MASPISYRPSTKSFLGNTNTREVHRLADETTNCQIGEIVKAGHAVTFNPDSLSQAHAEKFDNCAYCLGGSKK